MKTGITTTRWLAFGLIALGWVLLHRDLYLDPHIILPRDNWLLNFPMFAYVSNWLKHLHRFPNWLFTAYGGSWMEVTSINYLTLLPTRWIGTLITVFSSTPMNTAWKFSSLVVGQAIFYFGLYLLARKLFKERIAPWLTVLMAFISPLNFAVLHQEQVLALVITIPFQAYFFLESPRSRFARMAFFSIAGFSLNLGYPHHFFLYFVVLLLGALLFSESRIYLRAWFKSWIDDRRTLALSLLVFAVGIAPLAYSYLKFYGQISSPLRNQAESLKLNSYADYMKISGIYNTSIYPREFLTFLLGSKTPRPIPRMMDDRFLTHTPMLLLLLPIAAVFRIRKRGLQWFYLGALSLLSLGVHGPLPRLLWSVLPGLEVFRQWFHFADLLNLHLIFLTVSVLLSLTRWKKIFVLGVWLTVAGGLWVGHETMNRYRFWAQSANLKYDYADADAFAKALFNGEIKFQVNAAPKPISAFANTPLSPFLWANEKGVLEKAQIRVQATPSGFLLQWLERPLGADTLVIAQYNDGSWLATNQLVKQSVFLESLIGSSSYLLLSRKSGPWLALNLMACAVPFLLMLAFLVSRWQWIWVPKQIEVPG